MRNIRLARDCHGCWKERSGRALQIEKQSTSASCFSALHPNMASAVHGRPARVPTSGNLSSIMVTSPSLSPRLGSAVHFDCTLILLAMRGLAEHRVKARPTVLVAIS